ncbi:MAG: biopolymer transporter ExbD [Verrucomicrobia bacterium]|nr:biopolymer transporter ExbD [Verrucomicrobiota bacterium]
MAGRLLPARYKKSHFESDTEPQLDISSLIDVCFLLLIYFLVTCTIQPREQDLLMALPTPGSSPVSPAIPRCSSAWLKMERCFPEPGQMSRCWIRIRLAVNYRCFQAN